MPQQELILAIETSSRVGSVAMANENGLLAEVMFSGEMRHSVEILPCIRDLLARFHGTPDDIRQVYLSQGPGSFTGLRIAVTLAKAMVLANAVKVVAVDTLDVIAANVPVSNETPRVIAPILDAKRDQFFVATYERQPAPRADLNAEPGSARGLALPNWAKTQPDTIMTAEQFLRQFASPGTPVGILGDGLLYHEDRFKADGIRVLDRPYWSPTAGNVYRLGRRKALEGRFEDPLQLAPLYLMPAEVTLKNLRPQI